ncbi:MAG: FecR domain-containing protein, partial [Balneolaceae bacterium]|nr:FecR domain-containing protein [Balneolaceae bacterium]
IPDADYKLAQKIKMILEEDRSVLSADDYLIDRIVDHKKSLHSTYQKEISESKRASWEVISSTIHHQKHTYSGNKAKIHSLFSRKSTLLKAAAVLIVAAFLTVFYLQSDFNQPEMLTQSGTEQVTHAFSDGSNVLLRPSSRLYEINRTDTETRYKLEGEAYFNVNSNQDRRFIVEAGNGIVEVTGTSFNVREWSEETIVYLEKGSVRFTNTTGSEEVTLKPGEMAVARKNQSITNPVKAEAEQYLSWQQNQIVFENRTAESIIKELEYHYSIEIIAPEHIKDEVLGGSLSLENRSVSLENLGIVLGGKFSSIEDNTYQFVE